MALSQAPPLRETRGSTSRRSSTIYRRFWSVHPSKIGLPCASSSLNCPPGTSALPKHKKTRSTKGNALEDLLKAKEAWAADGRLSGTEKAALRKTIDIAGRRLSKPTQDIRPGQLMTDEQYTADYSTLAEETQNIRRRLCDKAMGWKSAETKP